MTDDNDNPIANMEGMQSAIVNGEAERLKELLANQKLDELQKDYLIELAALNPNTEIMKTLKNAPTK
ncbi:hypothetical protein [Alteromonas sp. ASW11-130]|uniref:hypothetical protein n=1 Tax=Alteromonas sp. ASW11-130 TaxID=3015775 RepID=UPI002242543E|nr:hypothetical protein [Alteromonas sp. ASW11-130]MCW8092850.1 hypothetical protein [Alteromonas sp. ASW11-130]